MINKNRYIYIYTVVIALFSFAGLVSCSEEDDTVEEYPNWAVTNDSYFNALSDSVVNIMAQNPSQATWKRLKSWSKDATSAGSNSDYVLVKVVSSGPSTETQSPLYSDTVTVHYIGRYIPSRSYPEGYEFSRSYNEPFDEEISVSSQFAVKGLVDGFTTALQYMHRGDHWIVYIPYQLGYGNPSSESSIESGSTLIFDIRLDDFWSPKASE